MFWNAWHESEIPDEVLRDLVDLVQRAGGREVALFGSILGPTQVRNDIDVAVRCDDPEAVEAALIRSRIPVYRISRNTYGAGLTRRSRASDLFDIVLLTSAAAAVTFQAQVRAAGGRLVSVDPWTSSGHLCAA